MTEVPEAWPPAGEAAALRQVVPVFPLPDVWLFPYQILRLHVFEPRYKELIGDCLDGPGRIVLGTIVEGHEEDAAGAPPIYPIAGLGEIGRHEKLEGGEFAVLLVGLRRVLTREVDSDRLYRRVEIEPAEELPIPIDREPDLRARLIAALEERLERELAVPERVPTSLLADRLTLHVPLPHREMNRLFSDLDLERRATALLAEHAQRPASTRPDEHHFYGDMFGEG